MSLSSLTAFDRSSLHHFGSRQAVLRAFTVRHLPQSIYIAFIAWGNQAVAKEPTYDARSDGCPVFLVEGHSSAW
jgi:hypothetical protein